MALTENEIKVINQQISDLENAIEEQVLTGKGLDEKIARLQESEKFNKKQWDRFNNIIFYYELEIEKLTGRYIASPILESDIQNHARSGGRLYQNPAGTDVRKIPEFYGSPVVEGRPYELNNKVEIYKFLNLLRYGTSNSGTSTILSSDYVFGSNNISFEDSVNDGWILLGNKTLLKIQSAGMGGSCSNPLYTSESTCTSNGGVWTPSYSYTIVDRVNDISYLEGESVVPVWNGFTNIERVNKISTNPEQQTLINSLITLLSSEITVWHNLLKQTLSAAEFNPDENMNPTIVDTHQDYDNYLTTWLLTKPVQDGYPGLNELITYIEDRDALRSVRAEECSVAKVPYYDQRINFSNARADVQSGTLKRIIFLSALKTDGGFLQGGTPQQKAQLNALKKLLEEG